jgi:hypothetical protein
MEPLLADARTPLEQWALTARGQPGREGLFDGPSPSLRNSLETYLYRCRIFENWDTCSVKRPGKGLFTGVAG